MSTEPLAGSHRPRLDLAARLLVVLGFGLLTVSWAMSAPAGGFPDEIDHYVRALSVVHGELRGDADPGYTKDIEARATPKRCCIPGSGTSTAWVLRGSRLVDIPARLAPEHMSCADWAVWNPGLCKVPMPEHGTLAHRTFMGTIEPGPYFLPGAAAHLTSDPGTAVRLMRLANSLQATLLIGLAVWAIWPSRRAANAAAVTGLLVAVSPMLLFIGASPSPSSVEVASGLAFLALLLRLTRPGEHRRRIWVALAVTGALLATSRSLGPVWIVLDGLAVLALAGWKVVWERAREAGRWAVGAMTFVGLAGATTAYWETRYQPGVPFDSEFFRDQIGPAIGHLAETSRELVGIFGGLDIRLQPSGYVTWAVAAGALALLALVAGRWRDRVLLVLSVAVVLTVAVLVSSALLRQNGFNLQGRHVLAIAITCPLLAGEIAQRRGDRVPRWMSASAMVVVVVATVSVQIAGPLESARRYDLVGGHRHDPPLTWRPPGGVGLWLGLVIAGAAGVGLGALLTQVRGGGRSRPAEAAT